MHFQTPWKSFSFMGTKELTKEEVARNFPPLQGLLSLSSKDKYVSSCMCRVVCGEFKNEGGGAVVGYFGIATKASSQL